MWWNAYQLWIERSTSFLVHISRTLFIQWLVNHSRHWSTNRSRLEITKLKTSRTSLSKWIQRQLRSLKHRRASVVSNDQFETNERVVNSQQRNQCSHAQTERSKTKIKNVNWRSKTVNQVKRDRRSRSFERTWTNETWNWTDAERSRRSLRDEGIGWSVESWRCSWCWYKQQIGFFLTSIRTTIRSRWWNWYHSE